MLPLPGGPESNPDDTEPRVNSNDQAVMSEDVRVPIVPSVVIVPLRVYPFCSGKYDSRL